MDLREYQRLTLGNEEPSRIIDRVQRLGRLLRYVAVEAGRLGYPLDEVASIDMEVQKNEP